MGMVSYVSEGWVGFCLCYGREGYEVSYRMYFVYNRRGICIYGIIILWYILVTIRWGKGGLGGLVMKCFSFFLSFFFALLSWFLCVGWVLDCELLYYGWSARNGSSSSSSYIV